VRRVRLPVPRCGGQRKRTVRSTSGLRPSDCAATSASRTARSASPHGLHTEPPKHTARWPRSTIRAARRDHRRGSRRRWGARCSSGAGPPVRPRHSTAPCSMMNPKAHCHHSQIERSRQRWRQHRPDQTPGAPARGTTPARNWCQLWSSRWRSYTPDGIETDLTKDICPSGQQDIESDPDHRRQPTSATETPDSCCLQNKTSA